MTHVLIDQVNKRFGANIGVDDLSLEIADGEFFVLLGPTGAGKTTTLRLIAGLEKPDSGRIMIGGEDTSTWSVAERDVALVFQYYSLYPRYTVGENLAFPLKSRVNNFSDAEIQERVDGAAKLLRIDHLLDRKTDKLSGGEMQRVSIGRAIVREPTIFLMDEPLSNLDAKLRETLRAELKDLQMKLGATFLFVTHDQIEAMSMGDRVGVLNEGKIVQVGSPYDIYNNPRDQFVASFVGSPAMNLLDAAISGGKISAPGAFDLALLDEGRGRLAGHEGALTLGIRAEDVTVDGEGEAEARIHHVENHGVEKIVTLRAGSSLIKATVPAISRYAVEDAVKFSFNQANLHGFDDKTGVSLARAA